MNLNNFRKEALLIAALALPGCSDDPDKCIVQAYKSNPIVANEPVAATKLCQENRNEIMTCIRNLSGYDHSTEKLEIACSDSQLGLHIGNAFLNSDKTFCVLGGATVSCEEDD